MALKIRLARAGAHKKPFYRVVVADARAPRDGRFIEHIGYYDPLRKQEQERVSLDSERALHWIARGAKPSRRVALFLYRAGVAPKPVIPEQTKKSLPRAKARARLEKAAQVTPAAQTSETASEAASETSEASAVQIPSEAEPRTDKDSADSGASEDKGES